MSLSMLLHLKTQHHPHRFTCNVCGKSFVTEKSHLMHRKVVHCPDEADFICNMEGCGSRFVAKSDLNNHIKNTHEKARNRLHCHICGDSSPSYNGLKVHLFKVHDIIDKEIECSQCEKKFPCKQYLQKHMEMNHRIREKKCSWDKRIEIGSCRLCGDSLSLDNAESHVKLRHETKVEEFHNCPICGTASLSMMFHLKLHHHPNRLTCDICGKSSISKTSLSVHRKAVHFPDETDYICNIEGCGMRFGRQTYLKRHVACVHNAKGGKKNCCHVCGASFFTRETLRIHMANIHGMAEKDQVKQHSRAHPARVLVVVEASDRELRAGGKVAVICSTWLSQLPSGWQAFVLSDTAASAAGQRGGACKAAGVQVVDCCPGNRSLGDNIVTSQYKREHVHMRLTRVLRANALVRWVISTEQDTWWNMPLLVELLQAATARWNEPLYLGLLNLGPFFILSTRAVLSFLGNSTFMDACRDRLLRCLYDDHVDRHAESCQGAVFLHRFVKPGALYNNDHLVDFCLKGRNDTQIPPIGPVQVFSVQRDMPTSTWWPDVLPAQFYNPTWLTPHEVFGSASLPPNLLAFHHADAGMMRQLHNLSGSGACQPG